jgi:hypothetical protein
MRTFVYAVTAFYGTFTVIKILSTASSNHTRQEALFNAIDLLITVTFFVWGCMVLVRN